MRYHGVAMGVSEPTEVGASKLVARPDFEALRRGGSLGRYLVLAQLGRGGNGVVYLAYDPELDRKVALKLLRPRKLADRDKAQSLQVRLIREAQALAKINHPNVVSVHDVGTIDGRDAGIEFDGPIVFVAMEYIDGSTLTQWRRRDLPGWAAVVDVFKQAGRGLAAAHRGGLVHRDFKPDNVMLVERPGVGIERVVVMDFGIALELDAPESSTASVSSVALERSSAGSGTGRLTAAGALMGTPAYMAPEQFAGKSVDARADQWGLCVSLYETLCGQRPFEGRGAKALRRAVREQTPRPFPDPKVAPRWLRSVVARGLERRPEDRYPNMEALLAGLDHAPRRRAPYVAGLLAAGLVGVGVYELASATEAASEVTCDRGEARVSEVWGDPQRGSVQAAFERDDSKLGATVWGPTEAGLDRYAAAWAAGYDEACSATHVHREQSTALLDRRVACLDRRKVDLNALITVFADADDDVRGHAVQAVGELPDVGACADVEALLAADEPGALPPKVADEVKRARADLAVARARLAAGQFEPAMERAQWVSTQADSLGVAQLRVEAQLEFGRAQAGAARYDEALETLEAAFFSSRGLDHRAVAAHTSVSLVGVATDAGQLDTAQRWSRHALAEAQHELEPDLQASLQASLGALSHARGELDEARSFYEAGLAIIREQHGPSDPRVSTFVDDLGKVAFAQGKLPEAIQRFTEASRLAEAAYGPRHPRVAKLQGNLANAHLAGGELDLARTHHERSIGIAEAALGADHPLVAGGYSNLGIVHFSTGDYDAALDVQTKARDIRKRVLPADHPHLGISASGLGETYAALERFDEAVAAHRESLRIWTQTYGAEHRQTSMAHHHLGHALRLKGDGVAAIEHLRAALEIRKDTPGNPMDAGHTQYELAQAIIANDGDRTEALALGREALAAFEPTFAAAAHKEIETWLKTVSNE